MFKVFSGSWRGIGAGNNPEVLFMQVGFEFRQHLHHFKGAALSVFMCIVLHANQQGESFPSYEQIRAETGINPDTIGRALEHLNSLVIDEQRVLLRYRIRDGKNRFVGGNRYIVFPTPEQLAQYETQPTKETDANDQAAQAETPEEEAEITGESSSDSEQQNQESPDTENPYVDEKSHTRIFPNVENSELGKSVLKKNHSFKKIKNMGANAPARPAEKPPQERIADFPADCQAGAKLVFETFNLRPPQKPAVGKKGGDFALWVNGLRALEKLAAEYGTPLETALRLTWQRWNQSPFSVAHPGALAKTMTSVLAQSTSGQNSAPAPIKTALEKTLENFKPRS